MAVMGTMGTIPGPTIECNVGDSVIVHFRNMDRRTHTQDGSKPITTDKLVHSLHTHGFVFAQEFEANTRFRSSIRISRSGGRRGGYLGHSARGHQPIQEEGGKQFLQAGRPGPCWRHIRLYLADP